MTPLDVIEGRARWCVVEGDAAEVLRSLPVASVNAVVTDPPSGISFMGAEWDHHKGGRAQWVAWLAGILAACRVACVDGARLVSWAMPRTSHWTGCAIEDAGWSIETKGVHLFGSGWPKGKSQLKPAAEDWWFARIGSSLPLNIDACRVAGSKPATTRGAGGQHGAYGAIAAQGRIEDDGAGRYPPTVTLGHSLGCRLVGTRTAARNVETGGRGESSSVAAYGHGVNGRSTTSTTETVDAWECVDGCAVASLDAQSGVIASGSKAGGSYARDVGIHGGGHRLDGSTCYADEGTAARFYPQFQHDADEVPFLYCAKPSRAEKNAGCESLPQADGASVAPVASGKVMRCAECRRTHPVAHRGPCARCGCEDVALDDSANDGSGRDGCRVRGNAHPTVKPVALMRWLIRLTTQPGDVVLDPFTGSGTTGLAALLEGRRFIGVERDPAFAAIARARLEHAQPSPERLRTIATEPVRVAAPDFGPLFGGAR